jgi:hypothetical protein
MVAFVVVNHPAVGELGLEFRHWPQYLLEVGEVLQLGLGLGFGDLHVLRLGRRINAVGFYEGAARRAEVELSALAGEFPFVAVLPQSALERRFRGGSGAPHAREARVAVGSEPPPSGGEPRARHTLARLPMPESRSRLGPTCIAAAWFGLCLFPDESADLRQAAASPTSRARSLPCRDEVCRGTCIRPVW